MFLVGIESRLVPGWLVVDGEIRIVAESVNLLEFAVQVDSLGADAAGDVNPLVLVRSVCGEGHILILHRDVGPGHVGVEDLALAEGVLVVSGLEEAVARGIQGLVVNGIEWSPIADFGLPVVEVGIVIGDPVQDVAVSVEPGIIEGAGDAGGHFLDSDAGPGAVIEILRG